MRLLPHLVVVVLAAAALLLAGFASLERSMIPLALDDEVVSISYLSESGDVLMWVGFRDTGEVAVDRAVVDSLHVGDQVEKSSWSTSLDVGEQSVSLRPSGEFWRLVVAQTVVLIVVTRVVVARTMRASGVLTRESG